MHSVSSENYKSKKDRPLPYSSKIALSRECPSPIPSRSRSRNPNPVPFPIPAGFPILSTLPIWSVYFEGQALSDNAAIDIAVRSNTSVIA